MRFRFVFLVAFLVLFPSLKSVFAQPTCNGIPATIIGTNGPDTLIGTSGDDVIVGRKGADIIDGKGGNDIICGGKGADIISGGNGDDQIFAGRGADNVSGNKGNDIIFLGKGDDIAVGGDGDDLIRGQRGNDTIEGKEGNDEIHGGRHADSLFGNKGNDIVRGKRGADLVNGGDGSDELRGGRGDDIVRGKKGNDFLFGGRGTDTLNGGDGDDSCINGENNSNCETEGEEDEDPPIIDILSPEEEIDVSTATIEVSYSDENGVDVNTLIIKIDNEDITSTCTATGSNATCVVEDLTEGQHMIEVSISDTNGNQETVFYDFDVVLIILLPEIIFTSPANLTIVNTGTIQVSGSVNNTDTLTINGDTVSINGNTFSATINLDEGINNVNAIGTNSQGNLSTANLSVIRDTTPPSLQIETPSDGAILTSNQVDVAGMVNEVTSGISSIGNEVTVSVNGINAEVANGSFVVGGLNLQAGLNTITAVATDFIGNTSSTSIQVNFQNQSGQKIILLSGSGQQGTVNTQLSQPLVVALEDENGVRVPGVEVTFEIVRGNGTISSFPEENTILNVVTDNNGEANVLFTLGARSGAGNNRVKATASGFVGQIDFCATAIPDSPVLIASISGDRQQGGFLTELARPFVALVNDNLGNPVPGIDVIFEAIRGGGSFSGNQTTTITSNEDGEAVVFYTLGEETGINNNLVTATVQGVFTTNFVASSKVIGSPENTSFSGLVLDNQDIPIEGVTIEIENTNQATTTNSQGRFVITGVPTGHVDILIDGNTTSRGGAWPILHFTNTNVSGIDNDLGMPIYMLPLDTPNGAVAGGNEEITILMKNVSGAELTIAPNSVTCPDGSSECLVSFTQVNASRMSMEPPIGSYPMLAWTVQPSGVKFDPPAKICIPNDGMKPGTQVEMYFFDATLEDWSTFGLATVTADGSQLCSDEGFGVFRGAWGSCIPPPDKPTCKRRDPFLEVINAEANGDTSGATVSPGDVVDFNTIYTDEHCKTLEFEWDFGDDTTGSGSSPSHIYNESGSYTANVDVLCVGGCNDTELIGEASVGVTVFGLQKTINDLTPEEKENVDFFVDNDLDIRPDVLGIADELIEVEVTFDGEVVFGMTVEGGTEVTYTPDMVGEYTITVTYEDLTEQWVLEIKPKLEFNLSPDINEDPVIQITADDAKFELVASAFSTEKSSENPDETEEVPVEDGSIVRWELVDGCGGSLSETESTTEDGFAVVTLNTVTTPCDTYSVRATLESIMFNGELVSLEEFLNTYDPDDFTRDSQIIEVIPGEAAQIDVTRSKNSYAADATDTITLTADVNDQFGTPVIDGSDVSWNLVGLGKIIEIDEQTTNGRAEATIRSGILAGEQIVSITVDSFEHEETIIVSPIVVTLSSSTSSLNISTNESATITATVKDSNGNNVADGTEIFWTTSTGTITRSSTVLGGEATATLSSTNGRAGNMIVGAVVNTFGNVLDLIFTTDNSTVAIAEIPVLAGDISENGFFPVEQIDGTFENVPVFAETPVRLSGEPEAVATVVVSSMLPVASYPFEEVNTGTVSDVANGNDGFVNGATLDLNNSIIGSGSLNFDGNANVTIPDNTFLDIENNFSVSAWVFLEENSQSTIVSKPNEYNLSIDDQGFVSFTIETSEGISTVTSNLQVELDSWNRLQGNFRDGVLSLSLGADTSIITSLAGDITPGNESLVIGESFVGNIDSVIVSKEQLGTQGLFSCTGMGSNNQISLDASGDATINCKSNGVMDPDLFGDQVEISVTASPEWVEVVKVVPSKVFAFWYELNINGLILGRPETLPGRYAELLSSVTPILGDGRDLGIGTYRYQVLGQEPTKLEKLVLVFAGIGLGADLFPLAAPVNVVAASLKSITKILATFGDEVTKFVDVLVKVSDDIKNIESPDIERQVFEYAPFFGKLSLKAFSNPEALRKVAQVVTEYDDLIAISKAYNKSNDLLFSGDDFIDLTVKVFDVSGGRAAKKFLRVVNDVEDLTVLRQILNSNEAVEGMARILRKKEGVVANTLATAIKNNRPFENLIERNIFNYDRVSMLTDLNNIIKGSESAEGIGSLVRIVDQNNAGGLFQVRFIAELTSRGVKFSKYEPKVKILDKYDIDAIDIDGIYYQAKISLGAIEETLGVGDEFVETITKDILPTVKFNNNLYRIAVLSGVKEELLQKFSTNSKFVEILDEIVIDDFTF